MKMNESLKRMLLSLAFYASVILWICIMKMLVSAGVFSAMNGILLILLTPALSFILMIANIFAWLKGEKKVKYSIIVHLLMFLVMISCGKVILERLIQL